MLHDYILFFDNIKALKGLRKLGINDLKPKQKEAIEAFVKGNVAVVLPTGYGKSVCYEVISLSINLDTFV